MSDALCGPSNALQQFKQQTSFDRTLQQDRLASRHSPSQGFRTRDPLAGRLDADFEAFQAGVALPELPSYQQRLFPNAVAQSSQTPSWASDFSRMQISPNPALRQRQQIPMAAPNGVEWSQGFREHLSQSASRTHTSVHSPQAFQHMARYGMNNFQNNIPQAQFAPTVLPKGKEPATEEFDEAAFERAFNQASLDLMAETETMEDVVVDQQPAWETGASTANYPYEAQNQEDLQEQARDLSYGDEARALDDANRAGTFASDRNHMNLIASDINTIEEQEQPASGAQADDDALAATARELLEKIQHNQTDKFKNSQFLGLMRKLRDREMRVEGDQMVETVRPAHDSTYGSAASTPINPLPSTPSPDPAARVLLSGAENHDFDHWESPYS